MGTKITALMQALNANLRERSEVITGALTALLARENIFLLGAPGTAKSMVCRAICESLSGGTYFEWQVSKFSTAEDLFGPPSFESLSKGVYKRETRGKLPEANIVFLDEVFKGSSAILNTLLPVLNERVFHDDSGARKTPVQTIFGASNELPEAQELGAFYDRFQLRYVVNRIADDTTAADLFAAAGTKAAYPAISLQELAAEQAQAEKVDFSKEMVQLLVSVRREINSAGIYVSDRKWMQSIKIIKAYAHLNGATAVNPEHFEILQHMLWNTPEQMKEIRRVVLKITNPLGEVIQKHMDAIYEIQTAMDAGEVPNAVESQRKVKKCITDLAKLGDPEKNKTLASAIEKAKALNLRILKEVLGVDAQ